MMKHISVLAILPALAFGGDTGTHELAWLVGCWTTTDKSAQEVWIDDGDGALAGFGVAIGDNSVKFYEILTIRRNEDGSLVYSAFPSGQASTSFTATEVAANSVVFVNVDHDYPQEIRYQRDRDRLSATISLLGGANPTSFDKVVCE